MMAPRPASFFDRQTFSPMNPKDRRLTQFSLGLLDDRRPGFDQLSGLIVKNNIYKFILEFKER
jgi:hypothetical protein